MSLKLKPTSSTESFEKASPGSHQAACVLFIDLGMQEEKAYESNETVIRHKVYLGFELLDETMDSGAPFVVGRDYTFSLNERAALRGVVKALRGGRDVGPDEEVDFATLLGKPCVLSLESKQSKVNPDKSYLNLASVSPPMRGQKPTKGILQPVYWDLSSEEDFPDADWLPFLYGKTLRAVVEKSEEWRKRGAASQLNQDAEERF